MMFVLACVGLVFAGAVATIAVARHVSAEHEKQRLAEALGLQVSTDFWRSRTRFSGRFQGTDVDVVLSLRAGRGGGETSTAHTRMVALGADPLVDLHPQGRADTLVRAILGGDDHAIGDPAFDAAVRVGGDPATAVALLGAEARAAVAAHTQRGGAVEAGKVWWESSGYLLDPDVLRAELERLVEVRQALLPGGWRSERLVANALGDPEPGVRLSNLRILAETAPDHARDAAAHLRGDPDPDVRFAAARIAGDTEAIRSAPAAVKRRAAERDPAVAYALAAAEDEAGLADLLQGTPAVRLAVCRALERAGSVHAVAALLPLADALLENGEVRKAASAAITAIQARIGPVDRGGLAVVEAGGEVSITQEADRLGEARKQRA